MTIPRRLLATTLAIAALASPAGAQIPDTDIWLATIRWDRGTLRIDDPVNVTHRPGYDNQPAFLYFWPRVGDHGDVSPPPGFLYSSADSTGSTDIYRYDPEMKKSLRITRTPESEYSPTPFGDSHAHRLAFCCVRVEADGTQRLWQFEMNDPNPRLVMTDVDSIGYFAWIDDHRLALFVLGNEEKKEPHTLRVADVLTQSETIVARGIGRSVLPIPGTNDVSFTMQDDDEAFRFFRLKDGRGPGEPIIRATGGGQDAAWFQYETMLMSAGTAIYVSHPGSRKADERQWHLVRDFAGLGFASITRMALSQSGQIAFVATMTAP